MLGNYSVSDSQRWVDEPNKSVERTEFARDRARVMHSSALRRLGVKTQVMEAGQEDFPRTRLTHSLEVAQVGRELGSALGCDPDLVDTACLSHDLGHPPFGHNGETALNELAKDIGGFEGNAQSFRLLTRLEPKAVSPASGPRPGKTIGLNLTRASLDAASKYPWTKQPGEVKFGVYEDDADVFEWVREGVSGITSCFEAQVMDIADDIAYSVHDIEDAIHGQYFNPSALSARSEFDEVIKVAKRDYANEVSFDELDLALNYLIKQTWWVNSFNATQIDMASLKNMTSNLIGKFTEEIEKATKLNNDAHQLTRHNANLFVPTETKAQIAVLKAIVNLFVMQRVGAAENYTKEQEIILAIVDGLIHNPGKLDPQFKFQYDDSMNEKEAKRAIIDQVASLTDSSARRLAQEFVG
jgi:dGTPase